MKNSGSEYYNYASTVFAYVHYGFCTLKQEQETGHISNGGMLRNSEIYTKLKQKITWSTATMRASRGQ